MDSRIGAEGSCELAVRSRTLASESESSTSGKRRDWLRECGSADRLLTGLVMRLLALPIFLLTARRAAVLRSIMGDVGRRGASARRRPRRDDDDDGGRSDEAPARPVRRALSDDPSLELAESSELTLPGSLTTDMAL